MRGRSRAEVRGVGGGPREGTPYPDSLEFSGLPVVPLEQRDGGSSQWDHGDW